MPKQLNKLIACLVKIILITNTAIYLEMSPKVIQEKCR